MVLFEPNEFLLQEDTTSVDKVVSRQALNILTTVPHVPSIDFIHPLVRAVDCTYGGQDEKEPERAVSQEFEVTIVIHRVEGTRALEVDDISAHPVLEFDCIFLIQEGSVLVVIVQVVVVLR